ncbi:hypothetical protein SKAU_G00049770 [Synaphobranchus kaupii]|uniref:Uncharacterized protein n=1 Tax=Synaphobranchus kaupii TaxID=118154 RepID=A0A9Q1G3S0_SYNKA|nr:hypothetical protein SKAU_G00049770 [Synaphobranchus kaupii]
MSRAGQALRLAESLSTAAGTGALGGRAREAGVQESEHPEDCIWPCGNNSCSAVKKDGPSFWPGGDKGNGASPSETAVAPNGRGERLFIDPSFQAKPPSSRDASTVSTVSPERGPRAQRRPPTAKTRGYGGHTRM